MLYRLVRPVKRPGSSIPQFVQRIPSDVKARAVGRVLVVPLGSESALVKIAASTNAVRFSLRTREPAEAKIRQGQAAAYLETVWRALRQPEAVYLTNRDAHALAGELYRAWADGSRERDWAITFSIDGKSWVIERPNEIPPEEAEAAFAVATRGIAAAAEAEQLEGALGPLVDRLLMRKGIPEVATECRPVLLSAFASALRDAFANRQKNAAGDFTPDPKAARFPEWVDPEMRLAPATRSAAVGGRLLRLTGLVDHWWQEAQRANSAKPSTYESYRNTITRLVAFLGHDDAVRVTSEDIVRFKDHRLASINPRTGKPISAKTVKDSDLSGLKTLFGWAVANKRIPHNPATGITIKIGKAAKLRSKGFTDAEAKAILGASLRFVRGQERPKTAAAKRWVP